MDLGMTEKELYDLELEIEGQGMIAAGAARYNRNLQKNLERGRQSVTAPFVYLQKELLLSLSLGIDDFINESYSGKAGVRKTAAEPLKDLANSKMVAYLTLKLAIDGISLNKTLLSISNSIGTMIELEIASQQFKKTLPNLYGKILRDLMKRTKNIKHRQKVFSHTLNKYNVPIESWEASKRILVGHQLIDLLIRYTGLCELKLLTVAKHKTVNYLQFKPEILKKINEKNFQCSVLTPYYKPMVIKPKEWENTPFSGGYISEYLSKTPLVKTNDFNYLTSLKDESLSNVYEAVNHLQGVPFKVDKFMSSVYLEIWDKGIPMGRFPDRESLLNPDGTPKNVFRDPRVDTDKELLIKFKRDRTEQHKQEIARTSQVLTCEITKSLLLEYLKYNSFYFVINLDTRGRMYTVSTVFDYQSDQKIRSLITFANGEKIGARGKYWLYVHTANTFGFDKVSFDERYRWTEERLKEIVSYVDSPFDNRGWDRADKPMEFLQACYHVKQVGIYGLDYVCNLPVSLDATCSGLQLLSIIARDETTAQMVNVLPNATPQSIYTILADLVRTEVAKDAAAGVPEANRWLQFGIDRSIVKRNVMTYFYGLKPFGARDQIFDEYKKQVKLGKPKVLLDDGFSDCKWLADIIWKHLQTSLPLVSKVMIWLQKVAKLFSKYNLEIRWVTPIGFPVVQDYRYLRKYTVKTSIAGSLVYTTLRKQMTLKDSKKNQSAISANLTHSLDSALAKGVALYCKHDQLPVPNLLMVHDSFATTPNRIDQLQYIIRKVAIDLFSEDYLGKLYNDFKMQLPDNAQHELELPPERGTLDVSKIEHSNYFFS
jgi:DNA-directed RNA polymerase